MDDQEIPTKNQLSLGRKPKPFRISPEGKHANDRSLEEPETGAKSFEKGW